MPAMTPTLWLILLIAVMLLAGSVFMYFKARHEAGQALECRTADMGAIERQTRQLQDRTPAAQQIKRVRAGAPASYDVDRAPDRRVADMATFRANLNQVEVTAAQHALLDMANHRPPRENPHPRGSIAFVPYQTAYARTWMNRGHQNTGAEVSHA